MSGGRLREESGCRQSALLNGDAIGLEGNGRIARHIEDALAQHRALDLGDVSGRLAFPVTVSALASNCNATRRTAGVR